MTDGARHKGMVLREGEDAASALEHCLTLAGAYKKVRDTFMLRQLTPCHTNVRKRLVKSPKVYIRDSGLLHALLGLSDFDALAAHPVLGASWEGWVVEQILARLPAAVKYPEAAPWVDYILACDREVQRLAAELWGDAKTPARRALGHGQVITYIDHIEEYISSESLPGRNGAASFFDCTWNYH